MSEDEKYLSLEKRVSVIEARLGIDPVAIVAGEEASAEAGAEAHVGNVQSDVAPPAVPESVEDALDAANEAETAQDALDHVNRAIEKWPDDEDLQAAKADLEKVVAEEQAVAEAAESSPTTPAQ